MTAFWSWCHLHNCTERQPISSSEDDSKRTGCCIRMRDVTIDCSCCPQDLWQSSGPHAEWQNPGGHSAFSQHSAANRLEHLTQSRLRGFILVIKNLEAQLAQQLAFALSMVCLACKSGILTLHDCQQKGMQAGKTMMSHASCGLIAATFIRI